VLAIAAGHDVVRGGVCDDQDVRPSVLIVDDHADFRQAASALLETEGFTVVGAAVDGYAAIAAAKRLRPEVVLLDVQLPGLDGFAVAELLADTPEPPEVVLISSREAVAYGHRLEAAPVLGFIPKRALSGAALAALVG
jgi:DNA-binding NarL/FixJ family response regulator